MNLNNIVRFMHRVWLGSALVVLFGMGLIGCGGGDATGLPVVAAWTSPQSNALQDLTVFGLSPPQTSFSNVTMRAAVKVPVGADRFRVKFSNLYGAGDLSIAKVVLSKATGAGWADPGTNVLATFNGGVSVTIPKGAEIWSDPVPIRAVAGARLIVSWYFDREVVASTGNLFSTVLIGPGDQTAAESFADPINALFAYALAGVDAYNANVKKVVVAFGDSITAGVGAVPEEAYPAQLQGMLGARSGLAENVSVVNEGIPGNKLLFDGLGPSAISRFDRDALDISGATDVILLLGINDIQADAFRPAQRASAEQVINALDALILRAKRKHLNIFIATLTPWKGWALYTDQREAVRQTVNAWIRTNKDATAVIDLDAALRSPTDLSAMNPAFDSGDHLHPNAAGYGQIALLVSGALR